MRSETPRLLGIALFILTSIVAIGDGGGPTDERTAGLAVPRAWNEAALSSGELPLSFPAASPVYVGSEYYYRIPERSIFKTYPVYAPGKEPPGYMKMLEQREPEIDFDAAALKTEQDWARAGEAIFDAPVFIAPIADVDNPEWYQKTGMPVARDGTVPFARYVVRQKGRVELGIGSCATCHTRVMADGSVIKGAQGNVPIDRVLAFTYRARLGTDLIHFGERIRYVAPWLGSDDPGARIQKMSRDEIASLHEAIPPGVQARHSTSPFYPVQVPDLIGVKDRHFFDRTGMVLHRSTDDLMRYAALVQGVDVLARYGDFRLVDDLPDPKRFLRYSDAQLYALALYLYQLTPPPNPNPFDEAARQGERIFKREGCGMCHTPPLYTNNKLTPAVGFKVPQDHVGKYDILPVSVGTDANLALKTRKGTGYYKVPSLKGVWYRGPFEHDGSVATLEDWFDRHRLDDDYVPTGFRGYGVKTRAVPGHRFGLDLSKEERQQLIAFLKTL
jgi:hypothetical protein